MRRTYLNYCMSFLIFSYASLPWANNLHSNLKSPKTVNPTTSTEKETLPKIGNFSLPASQQLGPLISFGHFIIDKDQTQVFLGAVDFIGPDKYSFDIIPAIIHQATDNLSIAFFTPIAARYKDQNTHSSGLGDAILQFEYSIYNHDTATFNDQATIVTYASLSTGSIRKEPSTGLGSPSFFLGGTFTRTYIEWYTFFSDGIVATTSQNGIKPGNQFLYQCGIGKNLCSVPSKYIFAALLELDGNYTEKTNVQGLADPDSGGNVIFVTPSLWFSSKQLILQLGVGFPVIQHLFGEQTSTNYLIAANIGWTF